MRNAAFAGRSTAEGLDILHAADVPVMPCHFFDTLLADPHLLAVGLVGEAEHPAEGRVRTVRSTVIADGDAPAARGVAPLLGADAGPVLERLGFSAAEVKALRADGAPPH